MVGLIWLSLVAAFLLIILLPLLFAQLVSASLLKLHLGPTSALLLVMAIILGGFINIPIKRIQREATTLAHPLAVFGFYDVWPEL
jgi:uncharacterized membrane protein